MNKQKINLITYLLIFIFFLFQCSFILEGGTTIDERSLDNSNQITLEKLRILTNFELFKDGYINPALKDIYRGETYGQFISFQQFVFSRIFVNTVNEKEKASVQNCHFVRRTLGHARLQNS